MAKKNYYAVAYGRQPGIYTAWSGPEGAEAQIKGYPGARYKGFARLDDAKGWFQSLRGAEAPVLVYPQGQPPEPVARTSLERSAVTALEAGKVVIYTDGGCIGNPGPGGYGVVLLERNKRKEFSGGFRLTTNNRMELMACIVGLRALEKESRVLLYSDSRYVVDGINKGWAQRWKANRWMRSNKVKAENSDLWENLLQLIDQHEVEFDWVRGHAGNPENERCDQLSMEAASRGDNPPDITFEKLQNNQLDLF